MARPVDGRSGDAGDRLDSETGVMMTRDQLNDAVREHLAIENDELRERLRISDGRLRESDDQRETIRVWGLYQVDLVADIAERGRRRAEDDARVQSELRDLRAMVVAEYYDDAVAVMGS